MTSVICSAWRAHDHTSTQNETISGIRPPMIISPDLLVLVADLALAILAVEAVALIAMMMRSGSASAAAEVSRRTFLLTTLSGFGLLVALRCALVQTHPALILAGLSLGGLAHMADLYLRTRRTDQA
jgi:hypothetical protein